ncbi:uncharacterized protein EV422DRAFT_533099 [Fimicolochytrium jonesii]|uniref:uncharacterized protein n=1 Tax=Fimicolochytrium jonesii TaxID=1396493 RepID=UPI0022FE5C38|nr:uncharacterized protein EV422DRAFT_533099 [Fimicolochytrium jonesii]KAI8819988.1 hypothetical protein EV422DRAFT_533099 [Fimicolochytrium jonesii]
MLAVSELGFSTGRLRQHLGDISDRHIAQQSITLYYRGLPEGATAMSSDPPPRKRPRTNTVDMDWAATVPPPTIVKPTEGLEGEALKEAPSVLVLATAADADGGDNFLETIPVDFANAYKRGSELISQIINEGAVPTAPKGVDLVGAARALQLQLSALYSDLVEEQHDRIITQRIKDFEHNRSSHPPNVEREWHWTQFSNLVESLVQLTRQFIDGLRHLGSHCSHAESQLRDILEGNLRLALTESWFTELDWAFEHSFQLYLESLDSDEDEMLPQIAANNRQVTTLLANLKELGFQAEINSAILATTRKCIKRRVDECSRQYDEPQLDAAVQWVDDHVTNGWLRSISENADITSIGGRADWASVFEQATHQYFCQLRISEIFEIICEAIDEFPEDALKDLRRCLTTTVENEQLERTLHEAIEDRALHPGVCTDNIINVLIATEMCLKVLDPTSSLLLKTISPMMKYLRQRTDTVKLLLARMLDEEGSLAEAIRHGDKNIADDEMDDDYEAWVPEPVDAVGSRQERNADIITRIIKSFDDQDAFVEEYHNLLYDHLIHNGSFNTDKETLEIELLKTRFGEDSFHDCEVMLMDMANSRRLHNHFIEKVVRFPEIDTFQAIVGSHLFWPEIEETAFKIPWTEIARSQSVYESVYSQQKQNRHLDWKHNAGQVQLELEMADGRIRSVSVTELQAAVVHFFSDLPESGSAGVAEVLEALRTPESKPTLGRQVLECVQFWCQQGVLAPVDETQTRWKVVEDPDEYDDDDGTLQAPTTHPTEALEAHQAQHAALRAKTQPAITALLTNQGAAPIEKVHTLLQMFIGISESVADVGRVLDELVAEGVLALGAGGKYGMRT